MSGLKKNYSFTLDTVSSQSLSALCRRWKMTKSQAVMHMLGLIEEAPNFEVFVREGNWNSPNGDSRPQTLYFPDDFQSRLEERAWLYFGEARSKSSFLRALIAYFIRSGYASPTLF